jgi:phosphate transport system substrate-binding protein
VDWAYKNGDKLASDLDYVPLPDKVTDMVRKTWASEIKGQNGQPLFKM